MVYRLASRTTAVKLLDYRFGDSPTTVAEVDYFGVASKNCIPAHQDSLLGVEYHTMQRSTSLFVRRFPALCGLTAPLWFVFALQLFGALRPEFRHSTKAVSELGVWGAPNALAWNICGFGAVGVLITVFAWGLRNQAGYQLTSLLVGASGLAFAATGVFPADMDDLGAFSSRMHIAASLVSFAAFVIAVLVVNWPLWRSGRRRYALALLAFGVAVVLSVLLRESGMPPGLAQRINFLGYLLWVAVLGIGTWKNDVLTPQSAPAERSL
jgi:hypothetical membrane protein